MVQESITSRAYLFEVSHIPSHSPPRCYQILYTYKILNFNVLHNFSGIILVICVLKRGIIPKKHTAKTGIILSKHIAKRGIVHRARHAVAGKDWDLQAHLRGEYDGTYHRHTWALMPPTQKNKIPASWPHRLLTGTHALMVILGGWWWIRTTEGRASRFTVCPIWPLW